MGLSPRGRDRGRRRAPGLLLSSPADGSGGRRLLTVGELLRDATERLRNSSSGSSREAYLLLSHVTGLTESRLIGFPETEVEPDAVDTYRAFVVRRSVGEPIAYLTGEREFYGRSFFVDPRVLIPRPETEHLIELALGIDLPETARILDLGTGSGCIGITLAAERPLARVWALDRSPAALAVAMSNRRRHGVGDRVRFCASDWGSGLHPRFATTLDLLVSNPPYIDRARTSEFDASVAEHEPGGALFASHGGLAAYQNLFRWQRCYAPQAALITEIGRGQLEALVVHAAAEGLSPLTVIADYSGIDRTVLWRRGPEPL